MQSVALRSSERRRVQLQACAAREPYYVATLRPVLRPDPLKRRRWSRSSGEPLTTPPIRPASAPACTSGPKTGGKMCGRPGVENPAGRYARSHCTATASWRGRASAERRRARRSGFGRRNRDGQLARALGGAGLRRSFLRPRVVRDISPRIRDSSLRDPFPTHPCLVCSAPFLVI